MTLRVALTFDAEHASRPNSEPGAAQRIIASLSAHHVQATFFVEGRWATAYPNLARSIVRAGHLIGSHSNSHVRMTRLSAAGLAAEIEEAQARIQRVVGADPRPWFRCPYGDGADDLSLMAALSAHGYRHVHWTVAAQDWDDTRGPENIEDDIVEGVMRQGDGAIVLLHTWPASTVQALPSLLDRLSAGGARFVTVADLPS
jgi:peptidoglycan/xylan/chitin deacetylase (PgdA/CDA1 family)